MAPLPFLISSLSKSYFPFSDADIRDLKEGKDRVLEKTLWFDILLLARIELSSHVIKMIFWKPNKSKNKK